MKKIEGLHRYFTKGERALWFGSRICDHCGFLFFDRSIISRFLLRCSASHPSFLTQREIRSVNFL